MNKNKYLLYGVAAVVTVIWLIFFPVFKEDFLKQFYYMPFLGIIAATVANTTPAAAGIVYFPILTRLSIDPLTAVQFNFIIQAYGMGLGSFKWFLFNKKLFMIRVLPLCMLGGTIGFVTSMVFVPIEKPEILTLIFNVIGFVFTQVIFLSILLRHSYPNLTIDLNPLNVVILFIFSFVGGIITGWIGFGIDTIFYFLLTFGYRINPAMAIVTSISLMAGLSIVGTGLNFIFSSVPISLWYSAVPGVTFAGLFLAAYFAVRLGARNILILFAFLLTVDFMMAFWTQNTIPMSQTLKTIFTYVIVGYLFVIHVKIFKQSYGQVNKDLGSFQSD
jgi:uncharacterized membrane protein YfcA